MLVQMADVELVAKNKKKKNKNNKIEIAFNRVHEKKTGKLNLFFCAELA